MVDLVTSIIIKGKNLANAAVESAKNALFGYTDAIEQADDQTRQLNEEIAKNEGIEKKIVSFSALRKESKQLGIDLSESKTQTTELGKSFADSSKTTNQLTTALADNKQTTKNLTADKKALLETTSKQGKSSARYAEILGSLNKQIATSRERTKTLTKSLSESKKETREVSTQFNSAKNELSGLLSKEQQATVATQKLRKELKEAGINTGKLARASKNLAVENDKSANALKRNAQQLLKAAEAQAILNKSTNKFKGILSSTTAQVVAFGATYLGLKKLKDGFFSILETGGRFETMQVTLQSLMGTVAGGEQAFAWIKEFAEKTPLQLDGVTNAFVKLKAFGLDPMDGTMQKLTDISSKMGGGQERLEGIILAVGQAWSKQKLQTEEANQLIERGIPVWDLMSKALGKTSEEVQKMASEGQLTRKEIKLLIDAMGDSAVGAAAKQMDTYAGLVSNAKDAIAQFYKQISGSGVLDFFKRELKQLLATTKQMAADGSLKKWAKDISDAIIGTASAIKSTIGFIVAISSELKILAAAYAGVKIGAFIASIASSVTALTAATGATTLLSRATTLFNVALKANPIGAVVGLLASLAAVIYEVKGSYDDLADAKADVIKAEQEHEQALKDIHAEILARKKADEEAAFAATLLTASQSELAEETEKVSEKTKASTRSIIELAQAERLLQTDLTALYSAFKNLSDDAIDGLIIKAEQLGNTDPTANWNDVKSDLISEKLKRIGIDLDVILDKATDTGESAASAFKAFAGSSDATTESLNKLAEKLLQTAKTKGDIELLNQAFKNVGFEIDTHPEKVEKITKKITGMSDSLDPVPQKWRDIGDASEQSLETLSIQNSLIERQIELTKRLGDAQDSAPTSNNDQDNNSPVLVPVLGDQPGSRNDDLRKQFDQEDAAREESRAASRFTQFDAGIADKLSALNAQSLAKLDALIATDNARALRPGRVPIDIEKSIASLFQSQNAAANNTPNQPDIVKSEAVQLAKSLQIQENSSQQMLVASNRQTSILESSANRQASDMRNLQDALKQKQTVLINVSSELGAATRVVRTTI